MNRVNTSLVSDSFLDKSRTALTRLRNTFHSPDGPSKKVFRDILDQSEGTYFGRKHELSQVRTMQDWKKAVPIRSYDQFRPYIDKLVDGDTNVLTASEPYALLRTSGSSGSPKLIPTTRHWRNTYRGPALYAQWGLYFETVGFEAARGSAVLDLSWERSTSRASAGSLPSYCISQRPAAVSRTDWLPPWYDEDWFRDVPGEHYKSGLYRKLRLLASADVRMVVTLNPSKIVGLAEVLAERADDLVRDLRNGTLNGEPVAGGTDRALAARLDQRRRGNGGTLLPHDLWPRLSLVVSWNSASAALYRPWVDELTPGIAKLPFSATGTEGIVTIPADGHSSAGPLAVDLGVYEFVPAELRAEDGALRGDVETLDYREIEVGQTYDVIMSQANGLQRYDLGDQYRVVDRVGRVPRLDFVGRAGFGSSFTGEKLTEEDVYTAVRGALGEHWPARPVFTAIPVWAAPPGYTLAIELPDDFGTPVATLADRIESELRRLNIEYAEKRAANRLTPLRVLPVPRGTFSRIEERRRQDGASPAQLKHHWIQRDDDLLRHIENTPVEV